MGSTEIVTEPSPVTSERSTSVANVVPITKAFQGWLAEKAMVHIRLDNSSGDVEVLVIYQTSDDRVTWTDRTLTTPGYVSSAGWTFGTVHDALTQAPVIRFAVKARNINSSTKLECVTVQLITGDNNIRDGVAEGVTLRFDPVDGKGAIVDLSDGKFGLMWEITLSSVTVGDDLLVMRGGSTQADDSTAGDVRLAGFTTYSSGAPRRSFSGTRFSNSTTGSTNLDKVIGVYLPMPTTSGNGKTGATILHTLDTSGAYLNNASILSDNETTPDPFEFVVFLGFDSAHTNVKTADVKVKMVAFELYP